MIPRSACIVFFILFVLKVVCTMVPYSNHVQYWDTLWDVNLMRQNGNHKLPQFPSQNWTSPRISSFSHKNSTLSRRSELVYLNTMVHQVTRSALHNCSIVNEVMRQLVRVTSRVRCVCACHVFFLLTRLISIVTRLC